MSDSKNIVTGLFVLVAVALSVSAWVVYPKPASSGMEEQVNKPLFDFDPKSVRGLSIVKYNEQRNEFDEVVMQNSVLNGWQVASKFNYPVDSAEKLVYTAASLSGLVVVAIASEDPNDEETYGVVEPKQGVKAGQKGVGIKVTLRDKSEKELASVIVGQEVKDQPNNRFVRVPGQRFIYVCEYDPSILDTSFFSWINPKVLTYGSQWSVAKVRLNKYSASKSATLNIQQAYSTELELKNNQWSTVAYIDGADRDAKPNLDVAELERVRMAIEKFEIQNVTEKSALLKQTKRERKPFPPTFLIEKMGFFVDDKTSPPSEWGAGGELSFTSDVGIRYSLLFGGLVTSKSTGGTKQRYVSITADIDESMFPMPVKPGAAKPAPDQNSDAPKPPKDGCEPGTLQDDDDREAERQYLIKLEERNKKVKEVQELADTINKRFADWFYVIDNDLYQLLMPAKAAIVSKNQ